MNKKLLSTLLLIGILSGCQTSDDTSSSVDNSSKNDPKTSETSSSSSSSSSSSITTTPIPTYELPENATYDAPTSGYALLVTPYDGGPDYYFVLQPWEKFDDFDQHFGDNIIFNEGDVFQLYDGTNSTPWVEDTLSQYGQYLNFEVTASGIKCNVSGIYDVYVKFKYGQDEVYIGNETGA